MKCFTAPEVLQGSFPSIKSDLYSVGAILYYVTFFKKS